MDRRGAYGPGLREVRPRSDPRKEDEAMARSEIMQKIEDLSEERGFWLGKGPTTRE
jgi:hypothetical protein